MRNGLPLMYQLTFDERKDGCFVLNTPLIGTFTALKFQFVLKSKEGFPP